MKKRNIYLYLSAFVLCATIVSCGDHYRVGMSVVSIEPTDETISLTLAGYAGPYLGRFTLAWDDMGLFGKMNSLAVAGDDLYVISDKKELLHVADMHFSSPGLIMASVPVRCIAGLKDRLYGVTSSGELLLCHPQAAKPEWENVGMTEAVTAITSSDECLYITTEKGGWLSGSISGDEIIWENRGKMENVCSMACDGNRLYALTDENVLYQCELGGGTEEWLRIGYNNGDSYTLDVRQIICYKNKLLALASDNHLYRSKHNTEGKLSARAMAVSKGKDMAVIVGVDVCGFDYSFTCSIKEEIYRRRGIPPEAILINASHSHYTPVTQSWITWEEQHQHPDTLYLDHVVRKGIIQAIEESIDNMVVSELFFGRDTTDIGRNRSLEGEFSIYDNSVDVLQIISKDPAGKQLLFLTGCHPVYTDPDAGNYMISPNYPGYARELLERETGVSTSLFLQACGGDINPKDPFKVSGRKLAESVIRALSNRLVPVKGRVSYGLDTIPVQIVPWSETEIISIRESAEKNLQDGVARRDYRWANLMIDRYRKGVMESCMPVYVQTITIGNWKLIGLSREATTEYGLSLKKLYPGQLVSVVGYTNDVASYLATDPHIRAKDYEGYGSFFWYGQPSCFPLSTLDTVVNKIK